MFRLQPTSGVPKLKLISACLYNYKKAYTLETTSRDKTSTWYRLYTIHINILKTMTMALLRDL